MTLLEGRGTLAPLMEKRDTMVAARRTRTATAESGAAFFDSFQKRVAKNKNLADTIVRTAAQERELITNVPGFIPVGNVAIERAMHLPGVPMGRIICIRGNFMGGKSTIAEHICAEAQKMGGMVVYIDTEYALDLERARLIGMSTEIENFIHPEVDTVEEVIEVIGECIDVAKELQEAGSDKPVVIVWDSVGGTSTKAEMTSDSAQPGLHSRLLSKLLRRITPAIAHNKITLILIGQEREKMSFSSPGMPQPTTIMAERPIMFHSTIVLRPMKVKTLTNGKKEPIGVTIRVECMKSKLSAPFAKAQAQIDFGPPWTRNTGLNNNLAMLNLAEEYGLVKKGASGWYTFGTDKFQAAGFPKLLRDNPSLLEDIEDRLADERKKKAKAVESNDEEYEDEDIDDEDDEAEGE